MKLRNAVWCLFALCVACESAADGPVLDLPPRPDDAPGGEEIARDFRDLEFEAREERVYREFARGNVPDWLRRLQWVEMSGQVDGRTHEVTFWTTPDYLALGTDDDFFFIPLSPGMAQRVAEHAEASLPTPAMVDAAWASARVRLVPIRFQPDEFLRTVPYFERHSRLVQVQLSQRRRAPGVFAAGHKLDVVIRTAPEPQPEEVAVYGWHFPDGTPLQPLHTVAPDTRPHYSMGVRLVHRVILVDGVERDLRSALRDPRLTGVLDRTTVR